MELKDKIVLITGSSQGIGREAALGFAKEGAKVVITYNSNKKKGEDVLKECEKLSDCFLVKLDVTSEDSVKKCVEKIIDKFGAIDVLVNNAGVISWKNFMEQSNKEIDLQIDTNLKGLIKMTKSVLPYFKGQDEGMIINVSSGAGKTGFSGLTTYCGTKFGVRGFTQAMAAELPKNIKIYSVNPGMTSTQMTNFKGVPAHDVGALIVKTAQGKVKVKIEGILVRDYNGRFETTSFNKFLRGIYEKWVITSEIEGFKGKIAGDCDEFLLQTKAYLDLEGKNK